ncbi:MAG: Trm112 family protein [Candidatus Hydrogenedentota bacterium]
MTEERDMIDDELLAILACPACKGDIEYDKPNQKLICKGECGRRYPIREGIPIMLIDEAELPSK